MRAKSFSLSVAFVLVASSASAQPAPKPGDDKKLITKVYSVLGIVGDRRAGGGLDDTDALMKLILETISIGEPKADGAGPQLVERDGGKLEVRATEKVHGEIKELIDALERLQDLAIDVKATVIELDPTAFEKFVKALPKGKTKAPVLFAVGREVIGDPKPADFEVPEAADKILKSGREVQTSAGRFANGADSVVSARKVVVPFKNDPNAVNVGAKVANPLFVKEGHSLSALSVVSSDRRFVRMKLTESSTAVAGVRKRELFELEGKKVVGQSLETEDLGATGSAVIADGGTAVFKLAYAPKEKVWVVVLKPTLFIQAEADEREREERLRGKIERAFPPLKPKS